MDNAEIPLTGGRITAGVVRIGNTVRRPVLHDRAVHRDLLKHLEAKGFEGSPRFLGIDERNREVLSFLPGSVPADLGHFSDEQLRGAADLLRRFHDVTADLPAVIAASGEVMCHNDWGPPNCVFVDDMPGGLIDFDTIAPGLRLWDLGYSAFAWLDIGNDDYSGKEQIRRMKVFLDGYGMAAYWSGNWRSSSWRDSRPCPPGPELRAGLRFRAGLPRLGNGPSGRYWSSFSPTAFQDPRRTL